MSNGCCIAMLFAPAFWMPTLLVNLHGYKRRVSTRTACALLFAFRCESYRTRLEVAALVDRLSPRVCGGNLRPVAHCLFFQPILANLRAIPQMIWFDVKAIAPKTQGISLDLGKYGQINGNLLGSRGLAWMSGQCHVPVSVLYQCNVGNG